MSMRVIGGELGGRRLSSPPGRRTRPTRSAVREAWFNAIAADLPGAAVIDMFAGTGALGIEALSRGAASAVFVESEPAAWRTLRRNIAELGLDERATVRRADVFRLLPDLAPLQLDLALADPPYGQEIAGRLLAVWLDRPFAGILCVEHGRDELAGSEPDWHRAYGDTELSFFIARERET